MDKFQLFKQAFDDSDYFINYYFNKRKNKPTTYQTTIDDRIVGMINIVDCVIIYDNMLLKSALITGVCVDKEFRNQGIMTNLMTDTLNKLSDNSYDIAFLSPNNDNYYKKYGFMPVVQGDWVKINSENKIKYKAIPANIDDTDLLLNLYTSVAKCNEFYQQINRETICDLFAEYSENDNDCIYLIYDKSTPIGWIVVDNDKIEQCILSDINILKDVDIANDLYYFSPNLNENKQIFQAKILSPKVNNIPINKILLFNKY